MSITQNLLELKQELPRDVTLVAVSKTRPVADLMEAYEAGQRIFGENKIQEMAEKQQQLPGDVAWHMIGHVQSNKVKAMAAFVDLIHGVDSLGLLKEINRQAGKHNRVIYCLLQIHIAEEETKFGLDEEELTILLESEEIKELKNIRLRGLMGMATFTEDQEQLRKEFSHLKNIFEGCRGGNPDFEILSMGMSGDYKLAIACGSTMVRVGSRIFGVRK